MNANRIVVGLLAVALGVTGCSSQRYEPEPVAATPVQAAALPASAPGDGTMVAGVVEWGRSWYGSGSSKGDGQFSFNGDLVNWTNHLDSERSFSLRAPVIKDVWLTCASRPGQNLCLDLGVRTLTDLEFHFRDKNWLGGDNGSIMRVYNHLKEKFPVIHFEEKVVEKVD